MKIKCDYVTNSSSTSFVLAAAKNVKKLVAKIEVDLLPYVEREIITFKDLDKYAKENGYEKDDEKMLKYRDLLKEGNVIKILNASSEDEGLGAFLHENGLHNVDFDDNQIEILDDGE